jgi:AraC family transcriptional regulator
MSVQASILRAIDLFEDRLRQPVRVAEAAEAAGYSLYHFCRLFSQTTRLTPYAYLMRRRLSQAAQDLLQTRRRVLDIALNYQFNSSEAFGRAFQRMFAVLPSRLRRIGVVDRRQMLPRFTSDYLTALEGLSLTAEKVDHPAIEIAGWMAPCSQDKLDFIPLWERVMGEIANAAGNRPDPYQPADISARYGLLLYPHDWQTEGCLAFAGVPAEELMGTQVRLAKMVLPENVYACFACESRESHLSFILEHLFHTWMPHSHLPTLPDIVLFKRVDPDSWLVLLPIDRQHI